MTHYRAARLRVPTTRSTSRVLGAAETAAWVVGAAVVTAVSAQCSITVPGSPIPFTLQPVAVLMAGALLGARLGALSQLTYLAMGVAGASAFAWSPVLLPGVARLVGPTGGFLLAFPVAAFVVGSLSDRGWMRGPLATSAALLAGLAALYIVGVAWATTSMSGLVGITTFGPYALADLVKLLILTPLVPAARRVVSR